VGKLCCVRVLIVFGGFLAIMAIVFVVFLRLQPTSEPLDCDAVRRPEAATFTTLDDEAQQDRMGEAIGCKLVDGLTRDEVQEAFGPPARTYGNALEYAFDVNGTYTGGQPYPPDTTAIVFGDDDRVADTESKDVRTP
jgi:hypothetical protein